MSDVVSAVVECRRLLVILISPPRRTQHRYLIICECDSTGTRTAQHLSGTFNPAIISQKNGLMVINMLSVSNVTSECSCLSRDVCRWSEADAENILGAVEECWCCHTKEEQVSVCSLPTHCFRGQGRTRRAERHRMLHKKEQGILLCECFQWCWEAWVSFRDYTVGFNLLWVKMCIIIRLRTSSLLSKKHLFRSSEKHHI